MMFYVLWLGFSGWCNDVDHMMINFSCNYQGKKVFSSINYHYFIVVNTKVGMIEKWVVSLLFSSWGKTDLPERRPLNVIIILTGWKEEENQILKSHGVDTFLVQADSS